MKKFNNIETTSLAKWLGNEMEHLIEEHPNHSENDLMALISERVENKIKEELLFVSEGFISDMVHHSFSQIDYRSLVNYYRS